MLVRSARLYLRPVAPDDAQDFFALDSDPEVMRHIGDGSVTSDPALTRAGLARVMAAYARRPGLGLWACCRLADEACVGWFALKPCLLSWPVLAHDPLGAAAPVGEHVEIGYRLRRDAWGQGYATEMAIELVRHGFERCALDEIVGVCKAANLRSARVLQRAGLSHRGQGVYNTTPVEVYGVARAGWQPPDAG